MQTAKTINRSYIKVTPNPEFWEIIKRNTTDHEFIAFHEPTIYLLEEEIWDEQHALERNFKTIAGYEFEQHLEELDPAFLPPHLEAFMVMFTIKFGSTVVDLLPKKELSYL
ncbi:MAG: hypothetical protein EB023_08705 [Flavobacteriia bacterium]|nr:hypothetical protein [Flavobacteriia bacterium]